PRMRVLGIDLGKVRIGLAIMDWESGIATPRPALKAIGTLTKDADQIHLIFKKEEAEQIVLGLPLEDGQEGKMANVMRRFGEILKSKGMKVAYVDESLTSHEADSTMLEAGVKSSQRKKALD